MSEKETTKKIGGVDSAFLRSTLERIEHIEEERKALAEDIKFIYQEAKTKGLDVKALKQLIKLRKQEPAELEEVETYLHIYKEALGM